MSNSAYVQTKCFYVVRSVDKFIQDHVIKNLFYPKHLITNKNQYYYH